MTAASPLRVLLACSATALVALPALAHAEVTPPSATAATPPPAPPVPPRPDAFDWRSSAFSRPHVGVEAILGFWTPLGIAGVTVIAAPHPMLSLEAGVGAAPSGPQLAAAGRAHLVSGKRIELSVAGGFSAGRYEVQPLVFAPTETWESAAWANGEVSLDVHIGERSMLRIFGGLGHLLSSDDACVAIDPDPLEPQRPCTNPGPRTLPSGGLALRFAVGG
jgi:hypothetical protein